LLQETLKPDEVKKYLGVLAYFRDGLPASLTSSLISDLILNRQYDTQLFIELVELAGK